MNNPARKPIADLSPERQDQYARAKHMTALLKMGYRHTDVERESTTELERLAAGGKRASSLQRSKTVPGRSSTSKPA